MRTIPYFKIDQIKKNKIFNKYLFLLRAARSVTKIRYNKRELSGLKKWLSSGLLKTIFVKQFTKAFIKAYEIKPVFI